MTQKERVGAYSRLLKSRYFELKVQELFNEGLLHGTTHLSIGQEASHTALCDGIGKDDWVVPTHRCHGFNIARGSSIRKMFSEMLGSSDGLCKGLGGSMHMADRETRNFGSSAVVGSSVALALGIALAEKIKESGNISVAVLGDGATSRGVVHESMNISSVWSLPILFFLEDNHYGMSASSKRMVSANDLADRAEGYSMKALKADGNDYEKLLETVREARGYIAKTGKPCLVVSDTYRLCGHSKSDKRSYRDREEEEEWREKDPIKRLESALNLPETEIERLRSEARKEVEDSYAEALKIKDGVLTEEEMLSYVYADSPSSEVRYSGMHEATYREALREALDESLAEFPEAVVYGEDVGLYGGCFGVTGDLYRKYPNRIMETPVSEEAFTTMASSFAAMGFRPIVEIMYGDFLTLSSDGVINHASKMRFMSAGQFNCPMVLRAPIGSGTGHGPQHTQSLEGMFLSVPGVKIVCPSDPFTAKALLKESVRDNNPVLFLEHKALYNIKGECGGKDSSFPIGKARVAQEGRRVTAVSYSRGFDTLKRALSGTDAELIDLVTIKPMDTESVKGSVIKTGLLLIVDDNILPGSVASSLASALLSDEEVFRALKKPARILTGRDAPIPFSKTLEEGAAPSVDEIRKAYAELTE